MKIQPSKKSQKKFKDAIRDIVKHCTSRTIDELIAKVNPIIRGWHNYVLCPLPALGAWIFTGRVTLALKMARGWIPGTVKWETSG